MIRLPIDTANPTIQRLARRFAATSYAIIADGAVALYQKYWAAAVGSSAWPDRTEARWRPVAILSPDLLTEAEGHNTALVEAIGAVTEAKRALEALRRSGVHQENSWIVAYLQEDALRIMSRLQDLEADERRRDDTDLMLPIARPGPETSQWEQIGLHGGPLALLPPAEPRWGLSPLRLGIVKEMREAEAVRWWRERNAIAYHGDADLT